MKFAHEDQRRKLYEYPVAKRLEITLDCVIGGHWHENKTEVFVLTQGRGRMQTCSKWLDPGATGWTPMILGKEYCVTPNTWHEFDMKAGSTLICLATKEDDPEDDHQ